jgi:hypothetical protein
MLFMGRSPLILRPVSFIAVYQIYNVIAKAHTFVKYHTKHTNSVGTIQNFSMSKKVMQIEPLGFKELIMQI